MLLIKGILNHLSNMPCMGAGGTGLLLLIDDVTADKCYKTNRRVLYSKDR